MGIKEICLPDLGEGVTEGEIVKIHVSEGEKISMDQNLLEVMTDKASMEVPSFVEGVIEKVTVAEGDIVSVGKPLFTVKTTSLESDEPKHNLKTELKNLYEEKNTPTQETLQIQSKSLSSYPLAAPSTRKLAEELGLPLHSIKGSGDQGEIKREDFINYIKTKMQRTSYVPLKPALTHFQEFPEEKREPLIGVKRLMYDSMTLSKSTIPHFTIGEKVRMDRLANIRTEINNRLKKENLKAGYLPFFIKALLPVLKKFPLFNSVYDAQTKEIVFRKNSNIGFAVDSPNGLLVPVLKEAENHNLLEIIKSVNLLAEKVRKGGIKREELRGASITISNLGSIGGGYGTPIINPPEMAIIGVYRLFQQTVQKKPGELEDRPFINISITCDHRFIDGATAARFLKNFINRIEEPSRLVLE